MSQDDVAWRCKVLNERTKAISTVFCNLGATAIVSGVAFFWAAFQDDDAGISKLYSFLIFCGGLVLVGTALGFLEYLRTDE